MASNRAAPADGRAWQGSRRRRHFFLVELLVADSRRTMELGRSAPMLTSASPGRAAAMVGGAGRAQRGTGSSATIAKFCSTDSGTLWSYRVDGGCFRFSDIPVRGDDGSGDRSDR